MSQPESQPRQPLNINANKILLLVAVVCAVISALCFAGIISGPGLAWLAGGIAAWWLSALV